MSDFRQYALFGLTVESNFPLSSPEPSDLHLTPDLRVSFLGIREDERAKDSSAVWYSSIYKDQAGTPQSVIYLTTKDSSPVFTYELADGVELTYDPSLGEVEVFWPAHYDPQDAAVYATGPLFALIRRLQKRVVLHGSAVAIDGKTVGFVGPATMGKSTLAATFVKHGFRAVTDDLLVLRPQDGHLLVEPGAARLSVWQSTVEALFGPDVAQFERLSPNDVDWDKRYLALAEDQYQATAVPLGALYLLEPRSMPEDFVTIKPVVGREVVVSLLSQLYGPLWPLAGSLQNEFAVLSKIATTLPVRRLERPNSLAMLGNVLSAVLEDFRAISQSS